MPLPSIVLASRSPRRRHILADLGCCFTVHAPDVIEQDIGTDPVATVVANAGAKFGAARKLFPRAALIAADTLVYFEGRLVGKPRSLEEAKQFLRDFSGRSQLVYTALALGLPAEMTPDVRVEVSAVYFKTLTEAAIQKYIDQVRPLGRAGAYDIDENGDLLIAGYSGSYTNIMGLPAAPVRDWLKANRLL